MQARVASFVLLASAILITAQESLRVRLAPTPSPQGQTLEIAGANGRLIEIDASAGLRQWISVAATNGSNEGVRWTDTNSAFFKQRFYRARAVDQAELPKGVTPVFAAGDVVTKLVGTNGGSLTLTDAAGSQFTLVIPPGALPNDETIELRSVAALEGVSLEGGLQAMVDLRPEGLHFMKASFVTIKPARALQQSKFIPLSYQAGREVSLELARVIDGQVSFSIMHFSGYGFGHGSMQDLANLQRRTPPKDMRQAGQRITDYLIMRQRSADPSPTPEDEVILEAMIRDIYNELLLPNAKGSLQNDFILICNVVDFIKWISLLQGGLAPIDHFTKEIDEVTQILVEAARNALDRSLQRCLTYNDPKEGLRFYRYFRAFVDFQKSGIEGFRDQNFDAEWSTYLPRFQKYFRFELDFESRIELQNDSTQIFHLRSQKIPIAPETAQYFETNMKGDGPLDYLQFVFTSNSPDCQITTSKSGSTLKVNALRFINTRKWHLCPDEQDPGFEIQLEFELGDPKELITANCSGQTFTSVQELFKTLFTAVHAVSIQSLNSVLITNWTLSAQSSLVAGKTFDRPIQTDSGAGTEKTDLILWHRPKP